MHADTITAFRGDYRFLSNFWPSPIVHRGQSFATVEHAYQCSKLLHWDRDPEFAAIRDAHSPGEAKRLGRGLGLKARRDFRAHRIDIMRRLIRLKFIAGSELALRLLHTGDALLEEGNEWHDEFWGVDQTTRKGWNHLGLLLMAQRYALVLLLREQYLADSLPDFPSQDPADRPPGFDVESGRA